MKMLCVTDVTVVEVDEGELYTAVKHKSSHCPVLSLGSHTEYYPTKLLTELVEGVKFKNHTGRVVCIGHTTEVQDALGIPFEALRYVHKTEREHRELKTDFKDLGARYNRFTDMGFMDRARFMFTRRLP